MKIKLLLLLLAFQISSCTLIKYANAVLEESNKSEYYYKNVLNSISFKGVVTNKKCAFVGNNRHQLVIKLLECEYKYKKFPSVNYYKYNFQYDTLRISVSKNLYKFVNLGDTVVKIHFSDSILLNENKLPLVSW